MTERLPPVIVSACLLGLPCRYDGQAKAAPAVIVHLSGRTVLPVCPETAAGLGIPRPAIVFDHGDVARVVSERSGMPNERGDDVAASLIDASARLVDLAEAEGATEAVLKARSPSCASRVVMVRDHHQPGEGVFAHLLRRRGLAVRSEEDID